MHQTTHTAQMHIFIAITLTRYEGSDPTTTRAVLDGANILRWARMGYLTGTHGAAQAALNALGAPRTIVAPSGRSAPFALLDAARAGQITIDKERLHVQRAR